MSTGLPGFLRRSLRSADDPNVASEHDSKKSDSVGSRASKSLIPKFRAHSTKSAIHENNTKEKSKWSVESDRSVESESSVSIEENDFIDIKFRMGKTSFSFDRGSEHIKSSAPNENHSKIEKAVLHEPKVRNNVSTDDSNKKLAKNDLFLPPDQNSSQKSYKLIEFEKVIMMPVVDIESLRKLSWNGIPADHRPQAWKILLGYIPTNVTRRDQTLKRKRGEYRDAIAQHYDIDDHSRTNQEQETLRQVLVDVPRTAPDIPLFRNSLVRQSLSRLLYIWACRHPASSYVQGINDLATPLIAVFVSEYINGDVLQGENSDKLTVEIMSLVEADVYWCLTNLLAGIQDHYTSDQPGIQRMVMRLEDLIARIDVGLTNHLRDTGVLFIQFAFRWMNCLLLREFNLPCIIRLWDTYLSEGDGGFETFHVYVCAAFLCQFSSQLQQMEFDQLFAFMQNIPTNKWGDAEIEILLSQAFVLSTLFQGSEAHLAASR